MSEPLRMSAYYYSFRPTGNEAIDRILSAVACAGKAFHHTESWNEEIGEGLYEGTAGWSPVDWIQNAADDAAKAVSVPRETLEEVRHVLEKLMGMGDDWGLPKGAATKALNKLNRLLGAE